MFKSSLRYGYIPSPSKPVVDKEPYQWTQCGRVLDLFAVSQDPKKQTRYTYNTYMQAAIGARLIWPCCCQHAPISKSIA